MQTASMKQGACQRSANHTAMVQPARQIVRRFRALVPLPTPDTTPDTRHQRVQQQQQQPLPCVCCCQAAEDAGELAKDQAAGINSSSSSSSLDTQPPASRVLQTDAKQLAELLVRLSQLQVKPHQQWLQDVLDTLGRSLPDLSAAQLASTVQVLGGWGYTPSEAFFGKLYAAMRQVRQQLTMRDIADMTWGLAQLHHPRQPMLDELLQAARQLMTSNSCAVAAAAGGSSPGSSGSCATGNSTASLVCCPASLADLLWSVAKLQHTPDPSWLEVYTATSEPLLQHCTPHQLAQIVWAFARLPHHPGEAWIDTLLDVIMSKLPIFDSKSVSLTAWGLATLKVQPSARWLFAFERQAERTLSTLAAAELACTLWALSELKSKRPHELRLGRLVRRQEVFWGFDFEALANPRLLRVVRQLTLGPQRGSSSSSSRG